MRPPSLLRSGLRGFSLAEVLIAIVIIAILTIGSIAVYSSQIAKARDTERTNDISRIKLLLDQFIAEYGSPPNPSLADAKRLRAAIKTDCIKLAALETCFKTVKYSTDEDLKELFLDPQEGITSTQSANGVTYGYRYAADQNSYRVCALLEDQSSRLLNYASDGKAAAAGKGDDFYCLGYAPPGVAFASFTLAKIGDVPSTP